MLKMKINTRIYSVENVFLCWDINFDILCICYGLSITNDYILKIWYADMEILSVWNFPDTRMWLHPSMIKISDQKFVIRVFNILLVIDEKFNRLIITRRKRSVDPCPVDFYLVISSSAFRQNISIHKFFFTLASHLNLHKVCVHDKVWREFTSFFSL